MTWDLKTFQAWGKQQMRMMHRLGGMAAVKKDFELSGILQARRQGAKLRMKAGSPWKDGPRRR